MTAAYSVAAEAQHGDQGVGSASWQVAHAALSRLARQRCAADAEEGRWLLQAARTAAHVYLGFGSFGEYIERRFGYQSRSLREKLRVADALEHLPMLRQALEQGELNWSAVRELTRAAVSDNEQRWLELARGKTVRQLEELVAGKHLGDDPDAPVDPLVRRRVLRFEVEAETFAIFREAMSELRRRSAGPVDGANRRRCGHRHRRHHPHLRDPELAAALRAGRLRQLLDRGTLTQDVEQGIRRYGFDEVMVEADFARSPTIFRHPPPGQGHHDGLLGQMERPDALTHLQAADVGQAEVTQHHLRNDLAHQRQAFDAIPRDLHVVTHLLEPNLE